MLFAEFAKAPMKDVLEMVFENVPEKERQKLTIESVSYSRFGPESVSFEVMLYVDVDKDQWISVCIQQDEINDEIREHILSKFNVGYSDSMSSISECISMYEKG